MGPPDFSHTKPPQIARHDWHHQKDIRQALARIYTLPMTPAMIQSFYARTPALFWPLLWLHIQMVGWQLYRLQEELDAPVDAIIGLGPCGTLRILSVAGLDDTLHAAWCAEDYLTHADILADLPPAPPHWLWLNWLVARVSAAHSPLIAAQATTALHLEPG